MGEPLCERKTEMTEQEKTERGQEETRRRTMRHATPPGENHKFVKNDQYFTVCIYTFVLVVASALAIKAIVSFDQTRVFFGGLVRAIGPFLIALLIAYVLNPFVKAMNRLIRKLFPRMKARPSMVLSMILVYILGLGLIITLLVFVLPEMVRNLVDLINQIPAVYQGLMDFLENLQDQFPTADFSSIITMLQDTQSDLMTGLSDIAGDLIPVLYTASVSVVAWVGNFLIALIVSVYMLYGKTSLKRLIKIVLCGFIPREKLPGVKKVMMECNQIFSRYLVSKMIDSFIVGVLCGIFMSILRIPYALLISVVMAIVNMIPYFGPFIGAIPGFIIILCVDPIKAVIFAVLILCLQQFDSLIMEPKIVGNYTGIKPIWIIFAVTIGGKFFGVAGMFLGVPVMATLTYLAELYMRRRLEKKGIAMEEIQ